MPSEKSKYLARNYGPSPPLDDAELKAHLSHLSSKQLLELICICIERDDGLRKALMASSAIQLAKGDWTKTKVAIDYALHFDDIIRYNDYRYALILDELIDILPILAKQISQNYALRVAQYLLERGQQCLEQFEDGWDWALSLTTLEKWLQSQTGSNING